MVEVYEVSPPSVPALNGAGTTALKALQKETVNVCGTDNAALLAILGTNALIPGIFLFVPGSAGGVFPTPHF